VVAPSGDNIVSIFRSGDATAANNAGGGFRSISSATAASRVAQIWLDADGANLSGGDYFFIQKNGNSGTVEFNQYSNAAMTFLTNNTERARISSDGTFRVKGAGTAGSTDAFQVAGTAPADAARIDSGGNLLVGTTSATDTLVGIRLITSPTNPYITNACTASTAAATSYNLYSTGAAAYRFYVDLAGTISATSIVITAISDQRLKENVRNIDTGLSEIMALKPRRFDWKKGKGQDKKNAAGFIAQEFETVFPECVGTSKAGGDGIEYKNINHETLIPTLVKAIQEQQTLITALTARIIALESSTLQ
jgi:hypothetical protein